MNRKTSGPICVAEPASSPAGSIDSARLACQAFAPFRPASDLYPLHRQRLISPTQQLLPDLWPVLLQKVCQFVNSHPVHASTSFVGLDSRQCLLAVSPLVPSLRPVGASPLSSCSKANTSWLFRRLSLMSHAAYSPLPLTPSGDRSGPRCFPSYYALC